MTDRIVYFKFCFSFSKEPQDPAVKRNVARPKDSTVVNNARLRNPDNIPIQTELSDENSKNKRYKENAVYPSFGWRVNPETKARNHKTFQANKGYQGAEKKQECRDGTCSYEDKREIPSKVRPKAGDTRDNIEQDRRQRKRDDYSYERSEFQDARDCTDCRREDTSQYPVSQNDWGNESRQNNNGCEWVCQSNERQPQQNRRAGPSHGYYDDPSARYCARSEESLGGRKAPESKSARAEAEAKEAEARAKKADAEAKKAEAEAKKADAEAKKADAEAKKAKQKLEQTMAAEAKIAESEAKRAEAEAKRKAEAEARKAEEEAKRVAEAEAKKADAEARKADAEAKKADADAKKAEAEAKKADAKQRASKINSSIDKKKDTQGAAPPPASRAPPPSCPTAASRSTETVCRLVCPRSNDEDMDEEGQQCCDQCDQYFDDKIRWYCTKTPSEMDIEEGLNPLLMKYDEKTIATKLNTISWKNRRIAFFLQKKEQCIANCKMCMYRRRSHPSCR